MIQLPGIQDKFNVSFEIAEEMYVKMNIDELDSYCEFFINTAQRCFVMAPLGAWTYLRSRRVITEGGPCTLDVFAALAGGLQIARVIWRD